MRVGTWVPVNVARPVFLTGLLIQLQHNIDSAVLYDITIISQVCGMQSSWPCFIFYINNLAIIESEAAITDVEYVKPNTLDVC